MLSARIGVKDLDKELRFYEKLGFKIDRSATAATVTFGEASFTMEAYDALRVRDRPLLEWDRTPQQLGAGVQLYVIVPNLDEFAASVPVGIPRPWPVQDKSWGLRELTLQTPSGYLLTFAQRH